MGKARYWTGRKREAGFLTLATPPRLSVHLSVCLTHTQAHLSISL